MNTKITVMVLLKKLLSKKSVCQVCRHIHPKLAEIDSVYGYICGPNKNIFLNHLECLQEAHKKSLRLAVCEDSTHRALRIIEASTVDVEEKQVENCLIIAGTIIY